MSPALRSVVGEIGKWGAIGLFLLLFALYFDTLKSATVGTVADTGHEMGPQGTHAGAPGASTTASPPRGTFAPRTSVGHQRSTYQPTYTPPQPAYPVGGSTYTGSRNIDLPSSPPPDYQPSSNYNYLNRTAAPPAVSAGPTVTLEARSDGHFYAPVRLNGREVETVIDTGATSVALSYDDAVSAGIYVRDADFTLKTLTANGTARAAPVMIDRIELDGITVRNVRATVAEPGRLHITLLGMSFLGKLARFEMRGRQMILHN